eukprot:TRINITY_DN25733_c0_g1_i1.p1 TRINITY_DN25733_c0_g1~~TRINITY_DN25733_c0_g1_i1.p1  ORF type:complete len:986 (+),score=216.39 TRINITY_DN25733_c0_g1_i1:89-3046(+)
MDVEARSVNDRLKRKLSDPSYSCRSFCSDLPYCAWNTCPLLVCGLLPVCVVCLSAILRLDYATHVTEIVAQTINDIGLSYTVYYTAGCWPSLTAGQRHEGRGHAHPVASYQQSLGCSQSEFEVAAGEFDAMSGTLLRVHNVTSVKARRLDGVKVSPDWRFILFVGSLAESPAVTADMLPVRFLYPPKPKQLTPVGDEEKMSNSSEPEHVEASRLLSSESYAAEAHARHSRRKNKSRGEEDEGALSIWIVGASERRAQQATPLLDAQQLKAMEAQCQSKLSSYSEASSKKFGKARISGLRQLQVIKPPRHMEDEDEPEVLPPGASPVYRAAFAFECSAPRGDKSPGIGALKFTQLAVLDFQVQMRNISQLERDAIGRWNWEYGDNKMPLMHLARSSLRLVDTDLEDDDDQLLSHSCPRFVPSKHGLELLFVAEDVKSEAGTERSLDYRPLLRRRLALAKFKARLLPASSADRLAELAGWTPVPKAPVHPRYLKKHDAASDSDEDEDFENSAPGAGGAEEKDEESMTCSELPKDERQGKNAPCMCLDGDVKSVCEDEDDSDPSGYTCCRAEAAEEPQFCSELPVITRYGGDVDCLCKDSEVKSLCDEGSRTEYTCCKKPAAETDKDVGSDELLAPVVPPPPREDSKARPETACCEAVTAECMACFRNLPEEALCQMPKYSSLPGCPKKAALPPMGTEDTGDHRLPVLTAEPTLAPTAAPTAAPTLAPTPEPAAFIAEVIAQVLSANGDSDDDSIEKIKASALLLDVGSNELPYAPVHGCPEFVQSVFSVKEKKSSSASADRADNKLGQKFVNVSNVSANAKASIHEKKLLDTFVFESEPNSESVLGVDAQVLSVTLTDNLQSGRVNSVRLLWNVDNAPKRLGSHLRLSGCQPIRAVGRQGRMRLEWILSNLVSMFRIHTDQNGYTAWLACLTADQRVAIVESPQREHWINMSMPYPLYTGKPTQAIWCPDHLQEACFEVWANPNPNE